MVISNDDNTFFPTSCLKFYETSNCKTYSSATSIADSSFECIECHPNYYVNNSNCLLRKNIVENCISYSL